MSTPHTTSPWKNLLPPAMVGTEKKPLALPAIAGAVGALLAQVQAQAQASSPAQALLQSAGVLTVCERAGQRPMAAASTTPNPHGVAAADTTQIALQDSALIDTVRWLLTDAPQRLQIDWLQHLAAAGWRLPPSLLPLALDTAQRASVLRPAVLAVLGERGRWLARHHRTWRYAAENVSSATNTESTSPDTRWQEGTLAQRLQLLQGERQSQPSAARERLQASLADLPAKERAELLAVLQEGLSAEDETLLTTLAGQDRSRDVRQMARSLLVQLPGSAISQRACARLAPHLALDARQRWVITPPEAADPSWKDEGIAAERPTHDKLGERAWWLYQLARQVPLLWWQQHTGMAPDALLQWIAKNDWAEAVVRAWWEVLRAAPPSAASTAWCRAFLDHWPGKAMHESPAAVLALLPAAEREPYWQRTLQAMTQPQQGALEEIVQQVIAAHPPGQYLSEALSALLVNKLALYKTRYYYGLPLGELCCVLHHSELPALEILASTHYSTQTEDSVAAALCQALRPHLPTLKALAAMRQLPRA